MSDLSKSTTPAGGDDGAATRKRELLRTLLAQGGIDPSRIPLTQRKPGTAHLPLSYSQEELWLHDQIAPGTVAFNAGFPPVRLEGPLDADALDRAVGEIVCRHEALRTTFAQSGGEPVQIVADSGAITLPRIDLQERTAAEQEAEIRRLIALDLETAFDLARGPLLRAKLLCLGPDTHVLLITVHHIVFDGPSLGVFFRELAALYSAYSTGRPSPLRPLPVQYADFALWQRQWLASDGFRTQLGYWSERLRDVPALALAGGAAPRAVPSHRAVVDSAVVPRELGDALRLLCRREGVTLYILLLAAFTVLLHRYSGCNDLVVGSPVTLRRRPELTGLFGLFVNVIALRSDLSDAPTFRALLGRVREALVRGVEMSDVPLSLVMRELGIRRSGPRNPLIQAALNFDTTTAEALEFDGLRASLSQEAGAVSRFDIEGYATDAPAGLMLSFACAADTYTLGFVRQMLVHFQELLGGIVAAPDARVLELPLLSEAERARAVVEWNRTQRAYPEHACVHELFAERARVRPDAVAVEYGGERLSYGELDARADCVAGYLQAAGAGRDALVGVYLERSVALVVCLLGILKAGGAYVPLDPSYPAERLSYMLEDTRAAVVLTRDGLRGGLPGTVAPVVCVDRQWEEIARHGGAAQGGGAGARSLAYVIYTSGSTGRPKGVAVTHRSINRLVCNTDYVSIGPEDRVAQASVVSFDAATFEIWGALLNGARVVGVAREEMLAAREFGEVLRERGITVLFLTTALFNQVAREAPGALGSLRCVLFGGEAVDVEAVRAVLRAGAPRELLHVYGPTEVTTFSTWQRVEAVEEGARTVPIGRPIANTTAYVLDEHGQPVPVGVAGELYLGGPGVARGYLGQEGLTAEKFVVDPFERGGRLYRTGDWVRYREDGALEFVGRRDAQVKVRGYRIELGEIESALTRLEAVREAVAVVRTQDGERRVVAYAVCEAGRELPGAALREELKRRLPEYMLPAVIVVLERLPLTPNGKVDRDALPAPAPAAPHDAAAAPRSELEQRIAAVWCEVLKVERVGVRENFFDLGGHSLLLARTCARLCAELDRKIRIVDLYTYPTIESLARHLGGSEQARDTRDDARDREQRRHGEAGRASPIAIIGMAGRFPGADDIESFWANLRAGREAIAFFSKEEMRGSGVSETLLEEPHYVGAKGYLADADMFDAGFFGYSAREAATIDPQQRLFVECVVEALDRAGYDPDRYPGLIGVYAGSSINTYLPLLQAQGSGSDGGLTTVLGSAQDFLTTRASYKLNLRGPSLDVQTACSTSLVAVHQACQALRNHECDMALAGGVSVTVPLKSGYVYLEEGILSRDGHCRAFDAGANGTVSGNGAGVVVLKRLADALADGDHIRAVILGTAVNNDGSSKVGYTAPSVEGQALAITLAHAAAQCGPDSIDYVEAHGTGTLMGDPIEVAALSRAFAHGPKRASACWIGSLKSNVGHLDAAAGVAGLIKTALSLEHRELVPSLHLVTPNPQIDFAAGGFRVNTELQRWEKDDGKPRRAGVSSFGMGGTNAHAVLEEAPAAQPSGPAREWQLLCLSAKTATALTRARANLARFLAEHADTNLADAAYTLQVGRREFTHRCIVVCRSAPDAAAGLAQGTARRVVDGICGTGDRNVVFMFSGQGAQYPNMGLGLYRADSVFRELVDRCCESLKPRLGLDLRDVLFPAEGAVEQAAERLSQTSLTQPALFVIEYALARLWMSLGVQPAAMIGHSVGEYVAACLAGVMSLEDTLDLVAERGRLMGQLPPGAMLAVALDEAELLPLLGERLSIAAVNSPGLCTVSGPMAEIAALEAELIKRGLAPRRLHTSHAFHSPMMEPILDSFTRRVAAIGLNAPRLPYISNVSGEWITAAQATDPAYYATHLRRAVRFSQGLERLFADPSHVFLEVGPGRTLAGLARRHPGKKEEHVFVASLRHPEESRADEVFFLESVGRLWLAGVRPDWTALHAGQRRRRLRLPTYPFEHKRYWIEAPLPTPVPGAGRIQRRTDPREWIYVPSWKRAPAPSAAHVKRGGSWLIFADRHELGAQLEAELSAGGARIVSVAVGKRYVKKGPGQYTLDPALREDYDRLIADLKDASFSPEHVVHLWSVSRDGELREGETYLAERQDRGFYSVVFLAQALVSAGLDAMLQLAVITTHAQDVTGEEAVCPEKAMVLGPCKVIGMEHPHIRARAIDVTLDRDLQGLARELTADLCSTWSDTVSAYRGRYRWVQTYERPRAETPTGRPTVLRDAGVYLITGGLGGMGLEIAAYFARAAGAKFALVSRSGLPAREQWTRWLAGHDHDDETSRRIRRVQAIEAAGAEVLLCKADVADERQMRAAVDAAEARFGKLCGVVHAAGAEKRGEPLQTVQRGHCEEQFRPKVQGLRVLEKVLRGKSLDFCVVHSSLASAMGVMGFVSYTAAHLYMDAFVHRHSRGTGTPWRTINWDNWIIGDTRVRQPDMPKPEFYMTSEEATSALAQCLSMTTATQVLVSSGDLQGRIEQWIGREGQAAKEAEPAGKAPAAQAYARPALSTEYAAPSTDAERTLAGIWREMLGIDRVGIHDNFFELGGDSVVNIQITARANQAGVRVTPRQVFEHQTIAALAAIAGSARAVTFEQGEVTGPVPLTPIQRWFFERGLPHPEHFNLPMLLEVRRPVDMAVLARAIEQLERHHDALRLRYSRGPEGWKQQLVEPGPVRIHPFDFTGLSRAEQSRRIEASGAELQKSLDLAHGPLLQAGYFDLGPDQPGRLLLAVHHLVVDMVSWRILLEDLCTLCEAYASGRDAALPAKTASIKRWAGALTDYAQTKDAEAELGYWLSIGSQPAPRLPVDFEAGGNTVASSATVHEELGVEETRSLLTELPRAYKTQIDDALLLALVKAVCGWAGGTSAFVDLEGHGREAIVDGIDVSRTVGWFTTLSPLRLELPAAGGYGQQIGAMRAQLQAVPHHGMGFGVLRYLGANPATRMALEQLPRPEISFLHMGQFDAGIAPGSWLVPAPEPAGPAHDSGGERRHLLEINSIVSGGRLLVSWTYSRSRHRDETARSLARAYMDVLRSLVATCTKDNAGRHDAPDTKGARISDSDLAEISRQLGSTVRVTR